MLKHVSKILLLLLLALTLFSADSSAEETEPWPLRDHYRFGGTNSVLLVDHKRAEWRLENSQGKAIIPEAYTELELGDGQRIRLGKEHWVTDGRDSFTDGFGKGTRFRSEFKPVDGLHVEFHLNRYEDHPFMTMMMVLNNTGKVSIELHAIRTGVIDDGTAPLFSDQNITMSNAIRRGRHTQPFKKGRANLMEVRIPGSDEIVGIGLLQSGFMHSNMSYTPSAKGGAGLFENSFLPAINIMPNSSAQTDAVWVLLSMTDSKSVRDFYAWTTEFVRKDKRSQQQLLGWLTVDDNESAETLVSHAQKWNVKNIRHALVPGTWQGGGITPGKYTMPLAELSNSLVSAGMTPGITVDPLSASKAFKKFTLQAKDGSSWLDIRLPKARAYGARQLSQLLDWRYQFFVVRFSSIPDDVLEEMNITRALADLVAFEMMTEAAGTFPVFPSTSLSLGDDIGQWEAVQHATGSHEEYNYPTGPVRLDIRDVERLSDPVNALVMDYNGPLEIVGLPEKALRKQLNDSFALVLAEQLNP